MMTTTRIPFRFFSGLSAAIVLCLLTLSLPIHVAAESGQVDSSSGVDAMFVLDISHSMRETDQEGIANEVIRMFMDMSDADRTRIGYVAYNHKIVKEQGLSPIETEQERSRLKQSLASLNRSGYTDLGLGLKRGSELMNSRAPSKDRPFIILLSDGGTDLHPDTKNRTLKQSAEDVESAIADAVRGQYPIYTIGLNHDGTVQQDELKRIAELTGGASYITESSSDLPEIFNDIFADHIQSELVPAAAVTATGVMQEVTVPIPNSSMEEVNIILLSEQPLKETQLYYSSQDVRYYKSNKYAVMKIYKPQAGEVKVKFKAQAGDFVKINLLSNYSLQARADIKTPTVTKGQPTSFEAYFVQKDGKKVEDELIYNTLSGELIVWDQVRMKSETIPLLREGNLLKLDYTFEESGKYTWKVRISGPDFYRITAHNSLEISNLAPIVQEQSPISLAKEDGDLTWDLAQLFRDPNQDQLQYELQSIENNGRIAEAAITDRSLILHPLRSGTQLLTIIAADPEGGKATAVLEIHVSSVWDIYKWVIGGVLAAIVIGLLIYWRTRPTPTFTGRLEGYFLYTASGNDIAVKYWPLTSLDKRRVTLRELFEMLDVHEHLPESSHIVFEPGLKGTLSVTHQTRCTITHGRVDVPKGHKEILNYNDKLYITFEDGATEIELRYKAVKPSTHLSGSNRDSNQEVVPKVI